ncbi:sigma-70 family RNA polymerase sigma factor [Sphingobacterium faecale]|uniref:Sigma-70 family RNA polymerase sigma factor n=1 Tax=Sphingobacterium faecale TaxID=2803775 RepID=A0ABS1R3A3_9SPHI|nr:sigma-70 family RNA polymerase sigma factor [Sphingobacterium faecale]MBL1409034.1 sigma-70 family RNA polymerase sigma factor [Sphingobacterium faecale]
MYIKPLSDEDKIAIGLYRDEKVFKIFFINNFKRLRDYAFLFLKDRHIAEDVVSEVMWKIWHLESDLVHIVRVEQYMMRAVKNKCLNLSRLNIPIFTSSDELENNDLRSETSSPEEILIQVESIHRINQAIELLPEKTRIAFRYVKEEKKTYKETAEKMNISVKTVDRHIQIAIKKLWDYLK